MRFRCEFLIAALFVAACGPSTPKSDAGPFDAPAYWGLADKECLHFDDGSGTNPVAAYVTVDNGMKIGGVTTYEFYITDNGFPVSTSWFGFVDNNLVLYAQDIPPSGLGADTYITYDPPPPYLIKDLGMGAGKTAMTTANETGATTGMVSQSWTINVEEADTLMADGQTDLSAKLYDVTVTDNANPSDQTTNQVWFAPQVGIVQLSQPNGMPNLVLTSVGQNVANGACEPP